MRISRLTLEATVRFSSLPSSTLQETMLERYKAAVDDQSVKIVKNKFPKWNEHVGAYVLNFNGRVTRASVKNFQLCAPQS